MGSYISTLLSYSDENQKENTKTQSVVQQVSKQNGEICTPTLPIKKSLIDPRSISIGIQRTPIEVCITPSRKTKKSSNIIPKYLQKNQFLETDVDAVMLSQSPKNFSATSTDNIQSKENKTQNYITSNINTAKGSKKITPIELEHYKILGFDPRSPAADFDRTPILKPTSLGLMKAQSYENLNCEDSFETDLYNRRNSYQEDDTSFDMDLKIQSDKISEELKMSNTENAMQIEERFSICQSDNNLSVFTNKDDVIVIRELKFNNTLKDELLISDKQTFCVDNEQDNIYKTVSQMQDCQNIIEENIKTIHLKDDKVDNKIWHDLLSEENISSNNMLDKIKEKENVLVEKISKENITFDTCTMKNTPLSKITNIEQNQNKTVVEEKRKPICTTNIRSDKEKTFTPDKYKNRIPLGNRSNDNQIQGMSPQLMKSKDVIVKMHTKNTPPRKITAKIINYNQCDL